MKAIALACVFAFIPSALQAGQITSVSSSYQDRCTLTEKLDEGGDEVYSCPGYKDVGIAVLAGHDSDHISFGPKAKDECAFRQGFTVRSTPDPSIEWRVKDDHAFAAIQRWYVSKETSSGQGSDEWLVVTRLEAGKTCRVAAIQATRSDAIAQARRVADENALGFDCYRDRYEIVASAGTAADDLTNGTLCEVP